MWKEKKIFLEQIVQAKRRGWANAIVSYYKSIVSLVRWMPLKRGLLSQECLPPLAIILPTLYSLIATRGSMGKKSTQVVGWEVNRWFINVWWGPLSPHADNNKRVQSSSKAKIDSPLLGEQYLSYSRCCITWFCCIYSYQM